MSTPLIHYSKFFQTPKSEAKRDEELKSYNSLKDRISSLPAHNSHKDVRLHQGIYLSEEVLLKFLWCQGNFKASPCDILLATYPKSGTTWLKALAFAILNRSAAGPPFSNLSDHPLLTVHPQDSIPTLEEMFATHQVPSGLDTLIPPPRAFATHSHFSLLPDSVKDSGCRIVYLCRDPKDTLVSLWHFMKKITGRTEHEAAGEQAQLDLDYKITRRTEHEAAGKQALLDLDYLSDRFCDGTIGIGSVWEHRTEYWKESLVRPDKVLFLEYENMLQGPEECVRRLAEFIGRPFSDEEEKEGVVGDIVKLCSIDFLKNLDVNKEGVAGGAAHWIVNKSDFFRNGKAGGWKEELPPEIAERMDRITREKLQEYHGIN